MKKTAIFTLLLLLTGATMMAQNRQARQRQVVTFQERRGVTLSGGFQVAVPKGEFAENYGRLPFGINAFLSVPLLNAPIELGGGFAWNHMASSREDVNIQSSPNGGVGTLRINGNSYTYQLHARLRPFNGRFRPYGEVFFGARNFSTTSKLQTSGGVSPTERLDRSFTFIAGWGVGAKYEVTPGVFLEARFESSVGSKATYIDPESISINDSNDFDFRNLESRTDQWAISVGVAFAF